MPRDIHGKPLSREAEPKQPKGRPHLKDFEAEPEKEGGVGDKDNKSTARRAKEATDPDDMLQNHHDRLKRIEEHLGIVYKPDDMKSEDQREGKKKVKAEASHDTEKGGKEYGRVVDKGGKMYERRRH